MYLNVCSTLEFIFCLLGIVWIFFVFTPGIFFLMLNKDQRDFLASLLKPAKTEVAPTSSKTEPSPSATTSFADEIESIVFESRAAREQAHKEYAAIDAQTSMLKPQELKDLW
jgi:hypothetical protein